MELNQVCFAYPRQKEYALAGINLTFEKGAITAIIGPNGSGKTTLTKLITGILRPVSGEIRLENRPLREFSLAETGRRIGYVFQNPNQQLFCSTVAEEIGFGLKYRNSSPEIIREKVEFYLDYFELKAYRNVFPLNLSEGEKQRLAIAAVLSNEPEFLILDEPTAGLDAYRKRIMEDYLKRIVHMGRGIVIVSHDFTFVDRVAERIVVLENGKILSHEA